MHKEIVLSVKYSGLLLVYFHQTVLDNNLSEITVSYESGRTGLIEKYYAKAEWPEAEVIALLVKNGAYIWLYECPPNKLTSASLHRPDLSYPLPRTILPPRLLAHTTRHRRPVSLLRKELRVVQLPPQLVPLYCIAAITLELSRRLRLPGVPRAAQAVAMEYSTNSFTNSNPSASGYKKSSAKLRKSSCCLRTPVRYTLRGHVQETTR